MPEDIATSQTPEQYLADLGYTNPDALEIAGAAEDLGNVGSLSSQAGADIIGVDQQKLAEITQGVDTAKAQTEQILSTAEGLASQEKALSDAKAKGGLTFEQAKDLFGSDFTGVIYDQASGLFIPDESALAKITPESQSSLDYANLLDNQINELNTFYDDQLARSNAATQALIQSIQQKFEAQRAILADANMRSTKAYNKLGIRLGASQYASGVNQGIIDESVRAGIRAMNELNSQEASLIAQAQQAQSDKEFEVLHARITQIQQLQRDKQDILEQQNVALAEKMNAIQAEADRINNENSIIELLRSGVTDPADIHAAIGGRASFAEITAITDTYTDKFETMQTNIDIARQSGFISAEELQVLSSNNIPLPLREALAFDVIRRDAKDNRLFDRKMDEATLANIYSQINDRNRQYQLELDKYLASLKEKGVTTLGDIKQDTQSAFALFSLANSIYNNPKRDKLVGLGGKLPNLFATDRRSFIADVTRLKDLLTLENLELMKGVLTDRDILILQSAATKLDVGLPNEKFVEELERIISNIQIKVEDGVTAGIISPYAFYSSMGFTDDDIADLIDLEVYTSSDFTSGNGSALYWYNE